METSLEDDDIVPPGGLPGDLDRRLDRLSPRVAKVERVQSLWDDGEQPVHQVEHGLVVRHAQLAVNQGGGLLGDCGGHLRVTVPGAGHPNAGREVQVLAAISGGHGAALRGLHDEGANSGDTRTQVSLGRLEGGGSRGRGRGRGSWVVLGAGVFMKGRALCQRRGTGSQEVKGTGAGSLGNYKLAKHCSRPSGGGIRSLFLWVV